MRITVCELPDESARRTRAWTDLVRYLHASPTEIVVLPEMPFCDWKMFRKRSVDLAAWRAALILLETTADSPFVTADVDLSAVDRARQTYPRNLVIP